LGIEDAKIALGIANSKHIDIIPVCDAVSLLDVEVLYTRTDWSDPEIQTRLQVAEKFEVLVPHRAPREMIIEAY